LTHREAREMTKNSSNYKMTIMLFQGGKKAIDYKMLLRLNDTVN